MKRIILLGTVCLGSLSVLSCVQPVRRIPRCPHGGGQQGRAQNTNRVLRADMREDRWDRREDVRDAKHDRGWRDRLEDVRDRREDRRDARWGTF